MAQSSLNFLPPYLQTTANKKFLAGTLDLLINSPKLTRFDGFIGRTFDNSGHLLSGTYIPESTLPRQNYQLEPAFVTFDDNQNIINISNFIDLLNTVANKEGNTSAWNRLLTGNTYSYKGFLDSDKLINYQNYVWLAKITENDWFWNSVIPTNDISTNIIGKENYSISNLQIMNGMIISTIDSNTNWIVEGVNQQIVLIPLTNIITPTVVLDQNNSADYLTINRSAIDLNLWSRTNLWIHKDTLNAIISFLEIDNSSDFQYALRPILEFNPMVLFGYGKIGLNSVTYYDAYTPNAISIVQGATSFEVDGYQLNDGDTVIFGGDKNILVRDSVYTINFIDPTLTTQISRLYPVKAISNTPISLSGIQSINGYNTIVGDRILVNNQSDYTKNGIYIVSNGNWSLATDFISVYNQTICGILVLSSIPQKYYIYNPSTNSWNVTINIPTIQLVQGPAIQNNSCTIVTSGLSYLDKTIIWNNNNWSLALQNKTSINQAPLFDVFDINGISFSDKTSYPSSSFSGSKLFSYEIGSGPNDNILGFPLSYGPIGNLNDVLFENNYVTDVFSYDTVNNTVPINIKSGRTHIIVDSISQEESSYNCWQYINSKLELYQNLVFVGISNISIGGSLLSKSTPNSKQNQVFIDGVQLQNDEFTISENNGTININITSSISNDSLILIKILASTPITNAWYDVPDAFQLNPFGQDLSTFNMSVFKNHINTVKLNSNYNSNILNLQLNQFSGVAGSLLYNESLSILPTLLLTSNEFNIDQAIRTASDAYVLFKQKLINTFSNITNAQNLNTKQAVDNALQLLANGNASQSPWATSDMCSFGGKVQNFIINNSNRTTFNLNQTYIWNQPNSLSLQVYLNDSQLINNIDYYTTGNVLTILHTLNIGDKLSLYEISNTNGCFIPATPTKLGLAAAYIPQIYLDTTYQTPRNVLQGHDGSIVECFNDYRDNLLLDYELRIYNNLKVNNQLLVDTIQSYVPSNGRFRSESTNDIAPYSPSEQLTITQRMFFEWAAQYNITNTNTFYDSNNLFTWNWSSSLDKLSDSQPLLGYWRGIYNWFYDSENPNTRPWEMLNLAIKPNWWDSVYGPAPYTGGNLIMWKDIANGIIRNPSRISYSSYGIRNSVLSVIPVDEYGNLLNPNQSVVGTYNDSLAKNDFVFGDGGPNETAWKRSSVYPFSKLRSQILQNPLFILGTLWDTNNYIPSNGTSEFRFQNNFLGSVNQIQLNSVDNNGNTLVNSIINYSIEYLRSQGKDPSILRITLDNTQTNLSYNLGGYADSNNITVLATPNNPNDIGAAELISNKDYSLFLNQSSPVGVLTYSGLIISIAPNNTGYKINGYDKGNPYFIIYEASLYSEGLTVGVSPNTFLYPQQFNTTPSIIPYNTIFGTQQEVINFIAGYEQFLVSEGLLFSTDPSQDKIDWIAGSLQFIKWSLTNWNTSQNISIIINPSSSIINYTSQTGTLYDLSDTTNSLLLDVNGNVIDSKYLDVYRDINQVTITHQGGGVFACIRANIVNYEHRFIINNSSSFNDTIYEPITGNRQLRLQLSGQKTGNWTGTLDCPGFLICTNQIDNWIPNQDYLQGSIVQWKNNNYVASNDIIGSSTFQYSQFGLINNVFTNSILPNLSLKALDYNHAYDPNYIPYITDLIKLRNNTIGYVERDWLDSLDIDLSSQSNFYRRWIKEKGTLASLNSYGDGSTSSLNTQVFINEEYAMKVGEYGSDNRTGYGEISLSPSLNTQNPLIISFVDVIDTTDTNTIQITPFNLYEKSINWNNDIIQNSGNLKATSSSLLSAGPIIPSRLIEKSYQNIPDFIKSDEDSLFFANIKSMVNSSNQDSILKITENNGSFWLSNNQIANGPNQWDVITFSPITNNILSITQLNPNYLSFYLSGNLNTPSNSVVVLDHIDSASNISIKGTFIVSDCFQQNGFSNLIISTNNSVLTGNSITYNPSWNSTSIYTSRSLRGNSIAESNVNINDTTHYVYNDAVTWAEYDFISPYTNEQTYIITNNQIPTTSLAYDDINQVLWFGKPSANEGIVEFRKLINTITSNNDIVSITGGKVYNIARVRSDTYQLGTSVVCSNIFAIANANSSNISYSNIGQLYVIKNNNNIENVPSITQILSADNVPSSYLNNASFGNNISLSKDGSMLFATWNNSANSTTNINTYSLYENNSTVTPNVVSFSTTLIQLDIFIYDPYSINIVVSLPNSVPQILIYGLEWIINPINYYQILLLGNPLGIVLPVGISISINNLPFYYKYFSTIITNTYISSMTSNEDGSIVVVGNKNNNSVYIYKLFDLNTGIYSLSQIITSPNLNDSSFGQSVSIQNNQLLIGSTGSNLNSGATYLYELDTNLYTVKTIPVSSIVFPISTFKINSWSVPTSSDISSLITNINSIKDYTGIIASYNNSNVYLTVTNLSYQTTGLVNNPLNSYGLLYSNFVITNELSSNDKNGINFGQNVKWISSDLFSCIENIGNTAIPITSDNFVDGTYYDGGNTNFSDYSQEYVQKLKIYQVLYTNRSWINSNYDILNPVLVKTIDFTGLNYPSIINVGDIANLFVIDANNPNNSIIVFNNVNYVHGWTNSSSQELPIDPTSISRAWIYDSITNTKLVDLEIVDINAGILPPSISSNIDYVCDIDPANYNIPKWIPSNLYKIGDRVLYNGLLYQALYNGKSGSIFNASLWSLINPSKIFGSNGSTLWRTEQIGKIWFKTQNLKTIDAQLGNIAERAENWNQWFPNSNIEIYEWVNSNVSPSNYVSNDNNGYVLDINCPYTYDSNSGIYGFWVYNKTSPNSLHPSVSVSQIINTISDIPNSGIPMISGIDNNVVAIWNINQFISSNTIILHIDYVNTSGNSQLHNEFALISNDGTKSWYNTPIYPKFVDSLSGVNTINQLIPDITLPNNQQTGILNNPQQSIFVDRTKALDIYFSVINENLANLSIASTSIINSLSIFDPLPTDGFDESIPSRDVLNELNIDDYLENYKILIVNDDSLNEPNAWSIVSSIDSQWEIFQTQLYNLTNNWKYTNWYSSNYNQANPTYTLNNFGQLSEISYILNDTILIEDIGNGNSAIYQATTNDLDSTIIELTPIFIENGTIQFLPNLYDFNEAEIGFDLANFDTQEFDNDPYLEIRLITQILNDTILTGSHDLTKAADDAFYAVLQYVIHENKNLDWLFKTSFITVDYINRNLNIQGSYNPDNQNVIENFINESTPFHTRIREFHDIYTGNDYANIGMVDFDLPAQYDSNYANIVLNYSDNDKSNGLLQLSQFNNNLVGMTTDEDSFYITSNGVPIIPSLSNIVPQTWSFGFAQEVNNSNIQFSTVTNTSGPIASAINGVPFYSSNSGIKETLYQNGNIANSATYTINTVWLDQQNGIDTGVGLPNNGISQYLSDPYLLYTKNPSIHSPLLGYAWDGVPIYGPYGYLNNDGSGGIILNTSSYKLSTTPRLDKAGFSIVNGLQLASYSTPTGEYIEDYIYTVGLGTLDQNNGRFCTTPEYPNGTYAYFVSIDNIHFEPTYPYVIGPTYYGIPFGLTYKYINGISTPVYLNGYVSLPQVNIANVSNFIRTPDGTISSDSLTLTQPIYSAWNNNHINNSQLIRSINTTLRFDRVKGDIEYMCSNIQYPKGEVLYSNIVGNFMQSLVSNANISSINDSNVWIVANATSIATSTAMNRIFAEYFPNSNMFANKANLLMTGVDYPEIIVSDGPFIESYPIPSGSIYDQDDQYAGNVALNLSWHSSLLHNTGLSREVSRFGNSSIHFNATNNEYLSTNISSENLRSLSINSNNFTLEFFINFSNISSNIMTMVDTRSSITSNNGLVIFNQNGNLCFGSNSNVALISSNVVPFIKNEWNYVTIQGNTPQNGNSNVYMYNNGLLIGSYTYSNANTLSTIYNFSDYLSGITLGADCSGNNVCSGYMDEIRLSSNINRYNINSINIDIPYEPFPRSIKDDPYFSLEYTPLLYGFETFTNESPAIITFIPVNSKTYINDLSWNVKNLELVNYNNFGNISIDSNEHILILN